MRRLLNWIKNPNKINYGDIREFTHAGLFNYYIWHDKKNYHAASHTNSHNLLETYGACRIIDEGFEYLDN